MWLWKKFWNTDIIGKIYILIILFIVIVATIAVITRYKNTNTNQVINEQQNEIIGETITSEIDVIDNNTITVAKVEDEIIEDDVKTNVETKEQEKSTISTENKSTEQTESKEETKVTVNKEQQTSNNETQTNKKEEVKQEEQQTEQKEDKQQETEQKENSNQEQQETNKQEEKQEIEEKEETTSQEIIREVKRNDTYIQKIKDYITTNDKSNYSIVVDSSIVNNTDGFTYSEFNLSGYIGCYSVYKIYAQDYYVNGEYVETRCYID